MPGAHPVERNLLERRLAPAGDARLPELRHRDQAVIVLCSDGVASSLAVASLRALGLTGATDVIGGFAAWQDAGLPVVGGARRPSLRFAAV